jgi:hypothetical protein
LPPKIGGKKQNHFYVHGSGSKTNISSRSFRSTDWSSSKKKKEAEFDN